MLWSTSLYVWASKILQNTFSVILIYSKTNLWWKNNPTLLQVNFACSLINQDSVAIFGEKGGNRLVWSCQRLEDKRFFRNHMAWNYQFCTLLLKCLLRHYQMKNANLDEVWLIFQNVSILRTQETHHNVSQTGHTLILLPSKKYFQKYVSVQEVC